MGAVSQPAWAGVYSTIEPPFKLNDEYFKDFNHSSLIPLRQVGTPNGTSDWQKMYALIGAGLDLSKLVPPPDARMSEPLTVEQRLDLGTCLIRLRRPQDAIDILRPVATKLEKDNFLVLSTLGTAYMLTGQYQTASDWLGTDGGAWEWWGKSFDNLNPRWQLALDDSFKQWFGQGIFPAIGTRWQTYLEQKLKWQEKDFNWFKECESYQRKLVRRRGIEFQKEPATFQAALSRLDPLFGSGKSEDQPHFVGESGRFEPGKIASAERAKIPKDAIKVVEQLLIWMPDDLRLSWLLGELLNAQGDTEGATIVFTDLFNKYVVLRQAGGFKTLGADLTAFIKDFPEVGSRFEALLRYKAPEPDLNKLPPVEPLKNKDGKPPQTTPPKTVSEVAPLNLDWQALAVGFGSGLVAGLLATWQWREIKRRRQARALSTPAREAGMQFKHR
jgi:hypothetical protein